MERRNFVKLSVETLLGLKSEPGLVAGFGEAIAHSSNVEAAVQGANTDDKSQTRPLNIEVDFSKVVGTIKPLNGVNGGPICLRGDFDLSSYFSEMGVGHVRLHDVPWMYNNAVDIDYVFPRDDTDVDDPQNYDFLLTDRYLESIYSLGADMTFRLGYSALGYGAAGPYHSPFRNAPPRDFNKWAAICLHIVKHYHQGWANGYHYDEIYWEVWNEPGQHAFWAGTPIQYYELYAVTAKTIKALDPSLKVGGPALARRTPLDFLEGFLKYCAEHQAPVDFVAWHMYSEQPRDAVLRAVKVQELLDKYGFSKAESILDEWNYFDPWQRDRPLKDPRYLRWLFADQMGGPAAAAYAATLLTYLQDTTVTMADFYQGTNLFWGGLFDQYGVPLKPYYALKAFFKRLAETPDRVMASGSGQDGFAVIAGLAKDKSAATVLISSLGEASNRYNISLRGLPWKDSYVCERYDVDSDHDLDLMSSTHLAVEQTVISEHVETPSVCLLRLRHLS